MQPTPDKRKFASTGDLESLRKNEASATDSPVLVNKHTKSSTSLAVNDSSTVGGGNSSSGSRRGTISIPTYKHDYSHVKSSVNSGE